MILKETPKNLVTLDTLVALCKRRGFIFQTAEIYGGLNGFYDFGHLGTLLKENIRQAWRNSLFNDKGEIVFLEGSIVGPEAMWVASGHVQNFHDPMVDCVECKHRYRADHIDLEKSCPNCGKKKWTEVRTFNMMFKTNIGASEAHSNIGYLRPETAQSIFVNFKNVLSTARVKLPFGIAQIGKAFRNEITPKQFLFRMREFEQMEIEWFCEADDANQMFEFWRDKRLQFYTELGINKDKLRLHKHEKEELAHYSTQTDDIEYNFPFGWKELEGIAHRGNFDLTQHTQHSGKDLAVFNEQTKTSVIPDVIECSVGTDRLLLTILFDSYREDTVGGEARTYFAFKPSIAPIKAAFFPLSKKLEESARTVFNEIRKTIPNIQFDVSGSIGKRYRRQDEIGTPLCFTYDFDSEETQTITVRDRNTTEQERIAIDQILPYIQKILAS
ncbi:MAG: glycine--tRNA ligase [Candidatus Dependentiae bacterium]